MRSPSVTEVPVNVTGCCAPPSAPVGIATVVTRFPVETRCCSRNTAVALAVIVPVPLPMRATSNVKGTQLPAPLQIVPPLSLQLVPSGAPVKPQTFPLQTGVWHTVVDAGQPAAFAHWPSQVMPADMVVNPSPAHAPLSGRATVAITVTCCAPSAHANVVFAAFGFPNVPPPGGETVHVTTDAGPTACNPSDAVSLALIEPRTRSRT